ncbi:Lcl C-terminal domain-containing protein [Candidatus Venteria ishoeyi]|uniref:Lcl C-terminal domain-containing protein n=1 Tax=Candidatus Venteria ishoeyi TaxID=1899563 RepID=A0A1H6FDM9_9GAMM|nr:DUF1566 domain-containing protein [Candidatus Venteria ishoeyi]SEH08190.1 Uncharacterised protein [Candidatus Venteria ishoeyi]
MRQSKIHTLKILGLSLFFINAPIQAAPLNDTGITFGGNYPDTNNSDCSGVSIETQDCSQGRDAAAAQGTLTKIGGGNAGFDFTKLDSNGNDLAASASSWTCVRDNVTGLIWEVKQGLNETQGDQGLHNGDDLFNWYNTDPATNGGFEGYADNDGAICSGYQAGNATSYCNTQAFVARVNAVGLCGHRDWRLPNVDELLSIVDNDHTKPSIDTVYFPNTPSSGFWSSSPYANYSDYGNYSDYAWSVFFDDGYINYNYKSSTLRVRLVRGGQR